MQPFWQANYSLKVFTEITLFSFYFIVLKGTVRDFSNVFCLDSFGHSLLYLSDIKKVLGQEFCWGFWKKMLMNKMFNLKEIFYYKLKSEWFQYLNLALSVKKCKIILCIPESFDKNISYQFLGRQNNLC